MNTLKSQRGAVLIAGLMILVILSLLVITAMQTSTIEEKMAYNMGQRQLAFQAAEAGPRQAEGRLSGLGGIDPTLPILPPSAPGSDFLWNTANRWSSNDTLAGSQTGTDITNVVEQPRYIVEQLQVIPIGDEVLDADAPVETETMYRITARGVGAVNTAEVILQATHLQ
ncbi:MAG: hypothetical protein IH612_21140 [Desulfofustis sp.]|nr:hypothetical protein [Desulfofustis sp.]